MSRDAATINLRHVAEPGFAALAAAEPSLIAVTGIKALFPATEQAAARIVQPSTRHPWGGLGFHVGDPDGTVVGLVEHRSGPDGAPR